MPTDREIAGGFANNAAKIITQERGQQHGELAPSFTLIAEWWSSLINHRAGYITQPAVKLDAVDVLEMMALLKKARGIYGSLNPDHTIDDLGYTALAGGLRLHDVVNEQIRKDIEEKIKRGPGVQEPPPPPADGLQADPPEPGTPGLVEAVDEELNGTRIPAFLKRGPASNDTQEG